MAKVMSENFSKFDCERAQVGLEDSSQEHDFCALGLSSYNNGEIKLFSERQNQREFFTSSPAPQEILSFSFGLK